MNEVGPTCRSARTRGSASLPRFRGSMREDLLGRILSRVGLSKSNSRPGGTAESIRRIRPSLRDLCNMEPEPGSELPGYCRFSLREMARSIAGPALEQVDFS